MLSNLQAHAAIAVKDLERAKAFYREKLGFVPVFETPSGAMYASGGSEFFLFSSPSAGTAKNSVMGWTTDNIRRDVAALKANGVVFEDYDYPMLKTVGGIAETEAGSLSAWFKDSEENTLGLVQFAR